MRNIKDAADAAGAMKPLAGEFASILFAAGLFNASVFSASILPLSTAYTVCEGMGFESGLDKGLKEAPFFYWFYTALIVLGGGLVLWPNFPLVTVIILSQVLNGVLLPVVMIFMLKLINKHELMGKHTNSTWFNWVAWITAAIVIALSLVMMWSSIHDAWKHMHGG
jgi:Mn2+/Fe2+ NRAMP family transporter